MHIHEQRPARDDLHKLAGDAAGTSLRAPGTFGRSASQRDCASPAVLRRSAGEPGPTAPAIATAEQANDGHPREEPSNRRRDGLHWSREADRKRPRGHARTLDVRRLVVRLGTEHGEAVDHLGLII
jgi:hypothetical protein